MIEGTVGDRNPTVDEDEENTNPRLKSVSLIRARMIPLASRGEESKSDPIGQNTSSHA